MKAMKYPMPQELADLIHKIAQADCDTSDMQELLTTICEALSQIMDTTNFYVALYDPQKDTLKFVYHADEMDSVEDYDQEYYDRYGMEHVSHLEGFTPEVIRTGKPLLIHKKENLRSDAKTNLKPLGTPSKVWLGVPLKIKNAVIGVLAVQSYSNPELYGDREMESLIAVSGQIALAIEHKKSVEIQKRNEEIRKTLFSIANAVNVTFNLEDLYRFIHATLNRVMDLPNFYIALYDKEKALLKFPYVVDKKDNPERSEFTVDVKTLKGFSLTLRVIETRKTLLIRKKKIMQLCREVRKESWGPVAEVWFGVPLQIRNEVIGVMCAQSYSESFRFNEKDLEILISVSDQVAIAIDRKRADEEAQKRAERLMVINRIGNAAANAHDLEKLMEAIYEEINLTFKPDGFFIAFFDYATNELEFRFLVEERKKLPIGRYPLGNGLSSKVIMEKKPLVIQNYLEEQHVLSQPLKQNTPKGALSWIGVPIKLEDQIIGLVNLQSYKAYAWNEEDIQLFFTITDQIVGTIAKARLYESVQQELNERKKAEEAKKDLETRLHQAQKMEAIGTLAGGIAHDFNNVLYPIIGFAEMTMDIVPEEGEVRKNLNEILVAAERAKDLVQQILTFSRQQEIKPRPLQIQPLLKEALKLIRSTTPSSISMIQNIDETCGPILADPSQIHQIIMNLCTNAYHAMRQQGGVLEISLAEVQMESGKNERAFQCEPGLYLRLTVRDTGHGIEPKIIDRIFDPYFTTKPPGEGTGMGLAMVHGIVKNYGGEITVFSQPEQGTIFKVFLPRLREKIVETEILEKKTGLGQGERVLFIDDEDQVIRMVKQMLERLGYEAVVKKDSTEALEEFRRHPDDYDLVITDQTMPNITGLELSKKLLKIRADIPIILCTGFSEIINEEQAQAAGIRKFIMKPITKKALAQIIRETLDES